MSTVTPGPRRFFKDKELHAFTEDRAAAIEQAQAELRKTTAAAVIAIGRELHKVQRRLAKRGEGIFNAWMKQRLKVGRRTAYKMISVHLVFGDCAQYAQTCDVSALYVLAQNGVPKQAIEEALALAKEGHTVTHQLAKTIIAKAYGGSSPQFVEEDTSVADIGSGVRPPRPKAIELLKAAWEQATPKERDEFNEWTKQRKVATEINPKTGERLMVPSTLS